MSEQHFDTAIVGGGIVGAATAYNLQKAHPEMKVVLFEKEDHLAPHQTGHNSGVIHSGLYYKPGSMKARLCVEGRKSLVAFAKEHNVAHDVCGKVVVATDEAELPHMERIFNNGVANNTEGIEKIGADQIREIEPHVRGIAGIWVPCTGIIDFVGATERMCELTTKINPLSAIKMAHEVQAIEQGNDLTTLRTNKGTFTADHAIFCGGLQADRLAKKDHVDLDCRIVGFRGDYYDLTEQGMHKVKNLIYPVPDPKFPFLGVHFTRMVLGGVECGPNAVFTYKREGYGKTDFDWTDTRDALGFSGTWKLFFKHWKFGLDEYRRAFSKRLFLSRLQRLIPDLTMEDLQPGRAGVRAMALGADGEMIDDFRIEYRSNNIHIINAPSPAATASLAIGEHVASMAMERFSV